MTVSELGERRLLARIQARLPAPPAHVAIGVGDDAAVVRTTRNTATVLTTDALVEGIHFTRAWSSPADIGHKALAVNLSDLAAMGARPRWALLSLALPDTYPVADVDGLLDGILPLAAEFGVSIIGGNLTRSPGPLMVDVTAVGEIHARRVLVRSGGRPGDELFVSGSIGAGAAGLQMLQAGREGAACIGRYVRPSPRVRLGMGIAQARAARAAMDLSDGLADAVGQVAAASGCGVELIDTALPIEPEARTWWESQGLDPVTAALAGGDDYELLLAVPPKWAGRLRHATRQMPTSPLTRIGVLTRETAHVLVRNGRREELPGGFQHWV